jgi:hypothetical protein
VAGDDAALLDGSSEAEAEEEEVEEAKDEAVAAAAAFRSKAGGDASMRDVNETDSERRAEPPKAGCSKGEAYSAPRGSRKGQSDFT